eukprot:Tbor_TRINITY_DN6098_c2_g6::TRINITY_DN6098_c2_g6_i4::g.10411::m.10411
MPPKVTPIETSSKNTKGRKSTTTRADKCVTDSSTAKSEILEIFGGLCHSKAKACVSTATADNGDVINNNNNKTVLPAKRQRTSSSAPCDNNNNNISSANIKHSRTEASKSLREVTSISNNNIPKSSSQDLNNNNNNINIISDGLYIPPEEGTLDLSDDMFFSYNSNNNNIRKTDDGMRIITERELKRITNVRNKRAGSSAHCPFDCDCCF